MAGRPRKRRCRICGCTDDDCSGCIERTGAPCFWVEPDLCSACHESLADRRGLRDLLSLAMDRPPPLKVIKTWTERRCLAAADWAGRIHLRASDNPIRLVKKPGFLQQWK